MEGALIGGSSPFCEIISEETEPSASKEATWQTENLVFDRDEYARKDFWDDRFRE